MQSQHHPQRAERREGDAWPVRRCLAAEASPAALFSGRLVIHPSCFLRVLVFLFRWMRSTHPGELLAASAQLLAARCDLGVEPRASLGFRRAFNATHRLRVDNEGGSPVPPGETKPSRPESAGLLQDQLATGIQVLLGLHLMALPLMCHREKEVRYGIQGVEPAGSRFSRSLDLAAPRRQRTRRFGNRPFPAKEGSTCHQVGHSSLPSQGQLRWPSRRLPRAG